MIGRKLALDKKLTVGSKLPLKGDAYPVDLDLTVRGIYDGPSNRDLRMCLMRFDYLDELLKRVVASSTSASSGAARRSGNAGMIFIKCKTADDMPVLCKTIDEQLSEQRLSDANPDRGSVRQDVRGDARGLEGDDPHHRPGRGLLAPLRRGQFHGHVDARANQRGGRVEGDRLQQATGAVPGPDRGRPGRRFRRRDRFAGSEGLLRLGRPLAVSPAAFSRSSTFPGTSRSRAWPSRFSSVWPAVFIRPFGRPISRSSTGCGGSSEAP